MTNRTHLRCGVPRPRPGHGDPDRVGPDRGRDPLRRRSHRRGTRPPRRRRRRADRRVQRLPRDADEERGTTRAGPRSCMTMSGVGPQRIRRPDRWCNAAAAHEGVDIVADSRALHRAGPDDRPRPRPGRGADVQRDAADARPEPCPGDRVDPDAALGGDERLQAGRRQGTAHRTGDAATAVQRGGDRTAAGRDRRVGRGRPRSTVRPGRHRPGAAHRRRRQVVRVLRRRADGPGSASTASAIGSSGRPALAPSRCGGVDGR